MELEPDLIEKLQVRYPTVNVSALAQNLGDARNPNAMLIARCRIAAERGTDAVQEIAETVVLEPHAGFFDPDGKWIMTGDVDDYWGARQGSVTRGVRQLVWLRRNEPMSPKQAAVEIEKREYLHRAFPSRESWLDFDAFASWPGVRVQTSAEAAVQYAGMGSGHRWPDNGVRVTREEARTIVEDLEGRLVDHVTLKALPKHFGPDPVKLVLPEHPRFCGCEECLSALRARS